MPLVIVLSRRYLTSAHIISKAILYNALHSYHYWKFDFSSSFLAILSLSLLSMGSVQKSSTTFKRSYKHCSVILTQRSWPIQQRNWLQRELSVKLYEISDERLQILQVASSLIVDSL